MFNKKYILIWCFTFIPKIFCFDMDYYLETPRRSESVTCPFLEQMYCQVNCGLKIGMCINSECYCLGITPAPDEDLNRPSKNKIDYNDKIQTPHQTSHPKDLFYALRPTVRHHIAHFCPDLDIARTCIRKCIKLGKPAFCGKDHVCYCGHKYNHMEDDPNVGANEMYAEFKDLYAKYFGINPQNKIREIKNE